MSSSIPLPPLQSVSDSHHYPSATYSDDSAPEPSVSRIAPASRIISTYADDDPSRRDVNDPNSFFADDVDDFFAQRGIPRCCHCAVSGYIYDSMHRKTGFQRPFDSNQFKVWTLLSLVVLFTFFTWFMSEPILAVRVAFGVTFLALFCIAIIAFCAVSCLETKAYKLDNIPADIDVLRAYDEKLYQQGYAMYQHQQELEQQEELSGNGSAGGFSNLNHTHALSHFVPIRDLNNDVTISPTWFSYLRVFCTQKLCKKTPHQVYSWVNSAITYLHTSSPETNATRALKNLAAANGVPPLESWQTYMPFFSLSPYSLYTKIRGDLTATVEFAEQTMAAATAVKPLLAPVLVPPGADVEREIQLQQLEANQPPTKNSRRSLMFGDMGQKTPLLRLNPIFYNSTPSAFTSTPSLPLPTISTDSPTVSCDESIYTQNIASPIPFLPQMSQHAPVENRLYSAAVANDVQHISLPPITNIEQWMADHQKPLPTPAKSSDSATPLLRELVDYLPLVAPDSETNITFEQLGEYAHCVSPWNSSTTAPNATTTTTPQSSDVCSATLLTPQHIVDLDWGSFPSDSSSSTSNPKASHPPLPPPPANTTLSWWPHHLLSLYELYALTGGRYFDNRDYLRMWDDIISKYEKMRQETFSSTLRWIRVGAEQGYVFTSYSKQHQLNPQTNISATLTNNSPGYFADEVVALQQKDVRAMYVQHNGRIFMLPFHSQYLYNAGYPPQHQTIRPVQDMVFSHHIDKYLNALSLQSSISQQRHIQLWTRPMYIACLLQHIMQQPAIWDALPLSSQRHLQQCLDRVSIHHSFSSSSFSTLESDFETMWMSVSTGSSTHPITSASLEQQQQQQQQLEHSNNTHLQQTINQQSSDHPIYVLDSDPSASLSHFPPSTTITTTAITAASAPTMQSRNNSHYSSHQSDHHQHEQQQQQQQQQQLAKNNTIPFSSESFGAAVAPSSLPASVSSPPSPSSDGRRHHDQHNHFITMPHHVVCESSSLCKSPHVRIGRQCRPTQQPETRVPPSVSHSFVTLSQSTVENVLATAVYHPAKVHDIMPILRDIASVFNPGKNLSQSYDSMLRALPNRLRLLLPPEDMIPSQRASPSNHFWPQNRLYINTPRGPLICLDAQSSLSDVPAVQLHPDVNPTTSLIEYFPAHGGVLQASTNAVADLTVPPLVCTMCRILQDPTMLHCWACHKCIQGFDHHCPYLNTCVGSRNYSSFYTMVSAIIIFTVCSVFVQLRALLLAVGVDMFRTVSPGNGVHNASYYFQGELYGHAWIALLVVSIVGLIFAVLAVGAIGSLWSFHTYLIFTGQTTREFLRARKEKKKRIQHEIEQQRTKMQQKQKDVLASHQKMILSAKKTNSTAAGPQTKPLPQSSLQVRLALDPPADSKDENSRRVSTSGIQTKRASKSLFAFQNSARPPAAVALNLSPQTDMATEPVQQSTPISSHIPTSAQETTTAQVLVVSEQS